MKRARSRRSWGKTGQPARPELPDACMVPDAPARRCCGPGCETRLRRSNPSVLCSVCERRRGETAFREAMLDQMRREAGAPRGNGMLCGRGCGQPVHRGMCPGMNNRGGSVRFKP